MQLIDQNCRSQLHIFADEAYSPDVSDLAGIWATFLSAECCRQQRQFATATRLIDAIEASQTAVNNATIAAAVKRHRNKIQSGDPSPIPDDLIAQSPPIWPKEVSVLPEASIPPNWIQKGFNFALAITSWAVTGFKTRTEQEISKRLAICRTCPELVNDHCMKCGCACVEANRLINKLALATEKCPIGKWD